VQRKETIKNAILQESVDAVEKYNALTKDIPARINSAYKKTGKNQEFKVPAGTLPCNKCQQPLSGQTVEVFGHHYHLGYSLAYLWLWFTLASVLRDFNLNNNYNERLLWLFQLWEKPRKYLPEYSKQALL